MPLKHPMETLLLVLLGLVIAITGVVLSLLPDLPAGTALWGIAWALSVAYPLLLYPMLKERRADYPFRMLHFFPALMLLVWLGLQIGAFYAKSLAVAAEWYTWGWTFPVVLMGFAALVMFSFHVIRQRGARVLLLLATFVPFVMLGAGGEVTGIRTELLAFLGDASEWAETLKLSGPVDLILRRKDAEEKEDMAKQLKKHDKNLFASADEEEETWRMRLRRMERREDRLSSQSSEIAKHEPPLPPSSKDILIAAARDHVEYGDEEAPPPPELTSSGPLGMDLFGVLMLAAWCGSVHSRTRRRM